MKIYRNTVRMTIFICLTAALFMIFGFGSVHWDVEDAFRTEWSGKRLLLFTVWGAAALLGKVFRNGEEISGAPYLVVTLEDGNLTESN